MRLILWTLHTIRRIATAFPIMTLVSCTFVAGVGFYFMPKIQVSTNLLSGVGETSAIINLTRENNELFGEQDAVIIVLEFAQPPGEASKPFIEGLGKAVEKIPGVRRVLYRFVDPENEDQLSTLFKHFLRGMNKREREAIQTIFSSQGIAEALQRNRNRLFFAENPYLQRRVLEDPLELGQFVAGSFGKRVGNISLGDIYLFVSSPDSTMYLIQVTPAFLSIDIARARAFVESIKGFLPGEIESLLDSIPEAREKLKGLNWYLTGKTVFHYETDVMFDREVIVLLVLAVTMVSGFLLYVYRSLVSFAILMIPLVASMGMSYWVIYLGYSEINPVSIGSSGILLGLGTDYGVHLWERFREEIDRGVHIQEALFNTFQHIGPSVTLAGLFSTIAFLCLCFAKQPAIRQYGFICGAGLILTLGATFFLFPALVTLLSAAKKDYFPSMKVRFRINSSVYMNKPRLMVAAYAIVLSFSVLFALRLSYEDNLYKVFLVERIDSMNVVKRISRKFQSNFSQPTFLSFDVDDPEEGIKIQRQLDGILEHLVQTDGKIAMFESVSYLVAPRSVQAKNVEAMSTIIKMWPQLSQVFASRLAAMDLTPEASQTMTKAFEKTRDIFGDLQTVASNQSREDPAELERSWYQARIRGRHRFLTRVRYSDAVCSAEELKSADKKIREALAALPVKADISGTRQTMEAVLESMVGELFRLGVIGALLVVGLLYAICRNVTVTMLSVIPMAGAFCITLGVMGACSVGVPFSIIAVAPLVFGLTIDSGIHVVMRNRERKDESVAEVMNNIGPPIIVTTISNMLGFLSLVISKQYSLQFLGGAIVMGLGSGMALTILALPAFILLLGAQGTSQSKSRISDRAT